MEDITPGLIEAVKAEFANAYEKSIKVQTLLDGIKAGTATYAEAQQYAIEVSKLIGAAYKKHVSSASLPDGRMYYNIAARLIPETLDENYRLVADFAKLVQEALNKQAGLGLKAQVAEKDDDRVEGLVELAAKGEQYDEVSGQLLSKFETYSQSIVDDTIQANVDFQGKSGLRPVVYRRSVGRCCDWCRALVGKYDYPVDREVYRRHENCRCSVLYDPGDGRRQDVHTKRWTSSPERVTMNLKKALSSVAEDGRRYDPDIYIPKSVGAKARNVIVRLPNGEETRIAPGSRITNVQTIAGLGRNRQIDEIDILLDRYSGTDALKWQKKKGQGVVEYHGEEWKAELHWYEEPSVGRVEFKVKPDADGNWFYED